MTPVSPVSPAPPHRGVHLLWLALLGLPCALAACAVPVLFGEASWPARAMGVPRPLWALAAAFVWSASGAALLWVLPRWGAPRPGVSLTVLTLVGAGAGLLSPLVVPGETPPGMPWLGRTLLPVLLISGSAAVALAAARVRRAWWVVAMAAVLFAANAGLVRAADPQRPAELSRIEADLLAYPHEVVVVGDTDEWHPFAAEVYSGEFTVTYRGPSAVHVVVRSGPETGTLGGGPDPLRSPCDDIDSLCEESADGAYVLPLNGPSPYAHGGLPTDRIRTEVAPGLLVEVVLDRESEIRPGPEELVKNVKALELRVAGPEDLTAIARGVHEWNRPEPWPERWLEPWRD